MKNSSLRVVFATLILAAASSSAWARSATEAGRDSDTVIVVAPSSATVSNETSAVHNWQGVRYDVPDALLRAPGVLINGLPPQPQQFD